MRARTGPCSVGAEHEPGPGPFGVVARPVADTGQHPGKGPRPGAQAGDGGVVLEPGQRLEHHRVGAVARSAPHRLRSQLPHGPAPRSLHGDDVEEAHPGMGAPVGVGERLPDHLVAGAHREHHGTGLHGAGEHAVAQTLGRLHLGPVLTAAEAVDVAAGGQRGVGERVDELHRDVSPHGAPGQHAAVPAVAVGAEQVGVHDHHPERRRARRRGAGAPPGRTRDGARCRRTRDGARCRRTGDRPGTVPHHGDRHRHPGRSDRRSARGRPAAPA